MGLLSTLLRLIRVDTLWLGEQSEEQSDSEDYLTNQGVYDDDEYHEDSNGSWRDCLAETYQYDSLEDESIESEEESVKSEEESVLLEETYYTSESDIWLDYSEEKYLRSTEESDQSDESLGNWMDCCEVTCKADDMTDLPGVNSLVRYSLNIISFLTL